MDYNIILTPIVGAFIGYTTNWIAIKMLFRPYTEKRIFGIKIPFTPGLIPKERERISEAMGDVIESYLLTDQVIINELTSEAADKTIIEFINENTSLKDNVVNISSLFENDEEIKEFAAKTNSIIWSRLLKQIIDSDNQRLLLSSLNINKGEIERLIGIEIIKKLDGKNTLKQLAGEELLAEIKKIVDKNQEIIKSSITDLINSDKTAVVGQEMVSKVIESKFGALGSMFANPASIFSSITEVLCEKIKDMDIALEINEYIEKLASMHFEKFSTEENKSNIAKAICNTLDADSLLEKVLIYFKDKINDNQQDLMALSEKYIIKLIKNPIELSKEEKQRAESKILSIYNRVIKNYFTKMIPNFKISKIVEKQINGFEIEQFEEVILAIAKKELRAITLLGGLLGFILSIVLLFVK